MVSDALAMQYILNSGHFALTPISQNLAGLVFGDGGLIGLRGKAHTDIRILCSDDAIGQMHKRIRNHCVPTLSRLSLSVGTQKYLH
jgi:hypothetical protein